MDIQEKLTAFAGLGATWVMWLLVLLSIVSLAIVLERIYYVIVTRDDVRRLRDDVLKRLKKGDLSGARKRLAGSKSFEAKIVLAGIDSADDGAEAAEDRMGGESQLARLHMERNLAFLGTVGNNAPFIGLLGTVIGIVNAFAELERNPGQVSGGLMAEIGEALIATAIGILVAIPAVAFFNFFQRVLKGRLGRADALGKEVLAFLRPTPSGDRAAKAAE